jgi:hypothetical protein
VHGLEPARWLFGDTSGYEQSPLLVIEVVVFPAQDFTAHFGAGQLEKSNWAARERNVGDEIRIPQSGRLSIMSQLLQSKRRFLTRLAVVDIVAEEGAP